MGATILLAAAMNALGCALTFGLSASLVWFAIDNIGTLFMNALAQVTHSAFWLNITACLLGALLNRLPDLLLPATAESGFQPFGVKPLVHRRSPCQVCLLVSSDASLSRPACFVHRRKQYLLDR
jgi:ABC-2 type transport system permease protein